MSHSRCLLLPPPNPGDQISSPPRLCLHVPDGVEVDRQLCEAVVHALDHTGHRIHRLVRVTVLNRHVILRGVVPSYYLKQLAQTAVLAIPGIRRLRNELVVAPID